MKKKGTISRRCHKKEKKTKPWCKHQVKYSSLFVPRRLYVQRMSLEGRPRILTRGPPGTGTRWLRTKVRRKRVSVSFNFVPCECVAYFKRNYIKLFLKKRRGKKKKRPEALLHMLWVELCLSEKHTQVLLRPGACECDFLWKEGLCGGSQVTVGSLGWALIQYN